MSSITLSYYIAHWLSAASVAIACGFFVFRVEAAVFDFTFWSVLLHRRYFSRGRQPQLTLAKLNEKAQQRIALFVPCWHESEVVDRMLETALSTLMYDRYEIFVGCYPNDPDTLEKVRAVAAEHPRVHAVVNDRPGPTTKAQNLNCVFRAMKRCEGEDPFSIVVLQDVEDVIHPVSFLLYNYLMPERDMVQIPVFPLPREWHRLLSWTYADEFCEHHVKDIVVRERFGAFVPSAGVGTAFNRAALDDLENAGEAFSEKALTEDYQIALRLQVRGRKTSFVKVRLGESHVRDGAVCSYVATRAYFPDGARAAIRQKARWIAGICLQSWRALGWQGDAATRYALFRDRKTVLANALVLVGYVNVACIGVMYLWHALDPRIFLPTIGDNPGIWALLDTVLVLTLLQLLQTAFLISWLYGPIPGILSMIRPPLAAYVNGMATFRALGLFMTSIAKKQDLKWNKTAHVFPTDRVLARVRSPEGG